MINYKDYEKLINKKCWQIKKYYKFMDFEELKAQANLYYSESLKVFDEKRGIKFSTFLYKYLDISFKNYIRDEKKWHYKTETNQDKEILLENIKNKLDFPFFELTDDSKKLVDFIRIFPEELKSQGVSVKKATNGITKQSLSYVMHSNCGYKYSQIKQIFNEIKEVLYDVN
jgi:hypothetical protein